MSTLSVEVYKPTVFFFVGHPSHMTNTVHCLVAWWFHPQRSDQFGLTITGMHMGWKTTIFDTTKL
jgi:hypothetical protein